MDEAGYFWDDLLQFIDERSVIPIVGQELLSVEVEGQRRPLYQHLAGQLAVALGLPGGDREQTLDQVVYRYLQTPAGRRELLYRRLRSVLSEAPLAVPEPLRQLAEITGFGLYVTTTVDSLLEQALNESRFAGRAETAGLAYSLNEVRDLPSEVERLDRPVVFYLFGRASSQPNYVLTEEDTLEFIHSMQSETRRPELLFDELRSKHLLLIGNSYSDWLARFFIRTVRNERLTTPGDREAILAGDAVCRDENLTLFLRSPLSYGTRVYSEGGATAFVDELYGRWSRTHTALPAGPTPPGQAAFDPMLEMVPGAVFLSYASDDGDRAERVKAALEGAGLDVWFDRRRLEAGDDYDLKIRRHVGRCSLFLPLLSVHTEQRLEGYFRREWRYAVDRAMGMDPSVAFVLPVALDEVPVGEAHVPEEFRKVQWTRLQDGALPEAFLQRLVQLVREHRRQEHGHL